MFLFPERINRNSEKKESEEDKEQSTQGIKENNKSFLNPIKAIILLCIVFYSNFRKRKKRKKNQS